MVDEGGNSSSNITFLRKSQGLVKKKAQLLYAGCVQFTVD